MFKAPFFVSKEREYIASEKEAMQALWGALDYIEELERELQRSHSQEEYYKARWHDAEGYAPVRE